jgi:hypothetical protein
VYETYLYLVGAGSGMRSNTQSAGVIQDRCIYLVFFILLAASLCHSQSLPTPDQHRTTDTSNDSKSGTSHNITQDVGGTPNKDSGDLKLFLWAHGRNNSLPFLATRPNFLKATFLFIPTSITGLLLFSRKTKRHRRLARQFLLMAIVSSFAVALFACGSKQSQTYSVKITATASGNGTSEAVTTSTVVNFTAHN